MTKWFIFLLNDGFYYEIMIQSTNQKNLFAFKLKKIDVTACLQSRFKPN